MDTQTSAASPARRTTRTLYQPISIHHIANPAVWPAVIPPLTDAEAIKAGRLLYQRFYRSLWYKEHGRKPQRSQKAIPVKITTGRRYSRLRSGVLYVNASDGWRAVVHNLSHTFHCRLRPNDRPHSDSHRHFERDMIAHVVASGWLNGKLVPKPRTMTEKKPKQDPVVVEHERILARIKAWETKAKRATTALAKLRKKEKAVAKRRAQIRFSL